jgi:hypothetical protein
VNGRFRGTLNYDVCGPGSLSAVAIGKLTSRYAVYCGSSGLKGFGVGEDHDAVYRQSLPSQLLRRPARIGRDRDRFLQPRQTAAAAAWEYAAKSVAAVFVELQSQPFRPPT